MRLLPVALVAGFLAAATPAAAAPFFDVGKLPAPPVTGKEIADSVAEFSEGYENRVTGSPSEQLATQKIAADAEALGYEVEILTLPAAEGVPGPSPLRAVVATKRGTTRPDEHIVFGGHYDVVPQTVQGAYDNGSGTMMLRALAKSFANVPTNRTLVFAWYNGEEEGTLASDPHAQSFVDAGKKVRAMLGFDMVGIGWPVANTGVTNCLCTWRGDEDEAFDALLKHVNFDVLEFPNEPNKVEHRGPNTRNSDEASWDVRGFPTMRWAGMRTAGNYPAYHLPDDTMATIDEVAGGRIFFEQGLRNTLLSSYYTALALDNEPPVARATTSGTGAGPHTFDASASTDPDGPVGDVVWDFGDGAKATGAKVTHEYAQPGVYTATVSVGDSLWSQQVRSTATVRVDVGPKPAAAAAPPVVAPQPLAVPARPAKKRSTKKRAKVRCRTIRVRSKRSGKRRIVRKCVKVRAKKQRTSARKRAATKKQRAARQRRAAARKRRGR